MFFFKKKDEGGIMDEIRCDERDYLIWKWRPKYDESRKTNKENAIRWGSPLRVRDGSVAVFVHRERGLQGKVDYIEGPFDDVLKTSNLPILANFVGLAYQGGTPFQAEVYFINLANIIQVQFGVPYFDVFDPRFMDFAVPIAVRGTLTFHIGDYKKFIKAHRLDEFDLQTFSRQIRDAVSRYTKNVVIKAPKRFGIPVIQLEQEIEQINNLIAEPMKRRLERDFAVQFNAFDIGVIDIDKTSEGYRQLMSVSKDITMATMQAQARANVKNIEDMQRINVEHTSDTLRRQREEGQYATHLNTQSAHMGAAQLNAQEKVGVAGAEALGQMGANGGSAMSGGGMDPAGMMAGMMMGGAIGQNMAGTMNNMMNGINQPQQPQAATPPPMPQHVYHVAVNGQAAGPYDAATLKQMAGNQQLTKDSLVWTQGMANWEKAGNIAELQSIFGSGMPPVPPKIPT